jgi:hypothetical protein
MLDGGVGKHNRRWLMKNIGLITYHALHNYGSVLQAYATQCTIEKMGCKCEIINFQPSLMKYFNALYKFPIGNGIPKTIKSIIVGLYRVLRDFPYDKKRRNRGQKFDNFVQTQLKITREYSKVDELFNKTFAYDITITGSDQTWNTQGPMWKIFGRLINYSDAYFLGFVKSGKKAAFAASSNNANVEDLMLYKDLLLQYDYITVRELLTKNRIESVINKNIAVILDPTFLLTKEEWITSLNVPSAPIIKEPYVLLYSLSGYNKSRELIEEARGFAKGKSFILVSITPNMCKKIHNVTQIYDVGPIDFLNLYYNASYVIADTFHAIAFSIIFRKSFIALGNKYNKNDLRKNSMLQVFNLESRLITDESEINANSWSDIDYCDYELIINTEIEKSKTHLKKILDMKE